MITVFQFNLENLFISKIKLKHFDDNFISVGLRASYTYI